MKLSRRMLILQALASQLPIVSWDQLVALGPPSRGYLRNLRRLVRSEEENRLIRRLTVLARPGPAINGPLFVWRPGDAKHPPDDPPNFDAIQYHAEKRNNQPVEAVTIFLGTKRLANVLGGTCGQQLDHHKVTHDLGTAAVFFYLWKTDPALALSWQGEDVVAPSRYRQKLPDAMLFNLAGQPMMAIEFIGDYPAKRIKAFHDDCANRGLAYELY